MLLVTVARPGMQEPLRAIPQPSTSAKSTREQSQGLGQTHLPHSGPQPSAAALPSRLRCPSRPPSPPAGDSGHWSGPETHPAVPRSGEGEDPCSDNLQPLTGPQPPDSLPRPPHQPHPFSLGAPKLLQEIPEGPPHGLWVQVWRRRAVSRSWGRWLRSRATFQGNGAAGPFPTSWRRRPAQGCRSHGLSCRDGACRLSTHLPQPCYTQQPT